jgi:hypothetical protein
MVTPTVARTTPSRRRSRQHQQLCAHDPLRRCLKCPHPRGHKEVLVTHPVKKNDAGGTRAPPLRSEYNTDRYPNHGGVGPLFPASAGSTRSRTDSRIPSLAVPGTQAGAPHGDTTNRRPSLLLCHDVGEPPQTQPLLREDTVPVFPMYGRFWVFRMSASSWGPRQHWSSTRAWGHAMVPP